MAIKPWTRAELKAYALELLDDPQQDTYEDARIHLLLDAAVAELVQDINNSPAVTSIYTETVTVVAGTREYWLDAHTLNVVEVSRELGGSVNPRRLAIVPFTSRDARNSGVYVYRVPDTLVDGAIRQVKLGTCDPSPAAMTLTVSETRSPLMLDQDGSVPDAIPYLYRPLVAIRAAVLGKGNEARELSFLASLYTENLGRFKKWLQHPNVSQKASTRL